MKDRQIEEEFSEDEMIEMIDEDGNPFVANLIASLEVDDVKYAIFLEPDNQEYVVVVRVKEDPENPGEYIFETLESEKEGMMVIEAYADLVSQKG